MTLHPRTRLSMFLLAIAAALTPGVSAQSAAPPSFQRAPGFPVTGRVLCADTQRPARFAQVILISAQGESGRESFAGRFFARTDLEGNFLVLNVPAGDYYVAGVLTGYVNTSQLVASALRAGTDPSSALAGVPLIHVSAGGASTALTLQRGGVIAGTVQWDDGSPAAGVSVSAQPVTTASPTGVPANQLGRGFNGFFSGAQTDDRGHYRLTGLAPGAYNLRASLQAPAPQRPDDRGFGRTLNLAVYAPGKVRRTDAAAITLSPAEERDDVNVVLGLAALHAVSGVVSSSSAPVRSGTVNLTDQTDSSLNRTGVIGPDGSFTVPYVPSGTYTLRISASSQASTGGYGRGSQSSDPSTRFQPLQESITVADTDLTGLNVTVTPASPSP